MNFGFFEQRDDLFAPDAGETVKGLLCRVPGLKMVKQAFHGDAGPGENGLSAQDVGIDIHRAAHANNLPGDAKKAKGESITFQFHHPRVEIQGALPDGADDIPESFVEIALQQLEALVEASRLAAIAVRSSADGSSAARVTIPTLSPEL